MLYRKPSRDTGVEAWEKTLALKEKNSIAEPSAGVGSTHL